MLQCVPMSFMPAQQISKGDAWLQGTAGWPRGAGHQSAWCCITQCRFGVHNGIVCGMWVSHAVQEEYGNEQEQWKAQLGVYLQKLHVEAHERTAAVELAAKEQQELEQKLWEVGV